MKLLGSQLWIIPDYFSQARFQEIKHLYRRTRQSMSMQYDDRILTPWSDSPALQQLVVDECDRIQRIVGQNINPQAAYVSIDLPGSAIMMHRLHPDIYVQVQISMSERADPAMDFSFCHNSEINQQSQLDYRPIRTIRSTDVDTVAYQPNLASVYLNDPRGFVGMLGRVPDNSIREVLILSFTRRND